MWKCFYKLLFVGQSSFSLCNQTRCQMEFLIVSLLGLQKIIQQMEIIISFTVYFPFAFTHILKLIHRCSFCFSSARLRHIELHYYIANKDDTNKCPGPKVNLSSTVQDILCPTADNVTKVTVTINGEAGKGLCSLYLSSGKNIEHYI